jgi:hypothetical protein
LSRSDDGKVRALFFRAKAGDLIRSAASSQLSQTLSRSPERKGPIAAKRGWEGEGLLLETAASP